MLILFFSRLYCSSFSQIKMLNLSTASKQKKSRAFSCLTFDSEKDNYQKSKSIYFIWSKHDLWLSILSWEERMKKKKEREREARRRRKEKNKKEKGKMYTCFIILGRRGEEWISSLHSQFAVTPWIDILVKEQFPFVMYMYAFFI